MQQLFLENCCDCPCNSPKESWLIMFEYEEKDNLIYKMHPISLLVYTLVVFGLALIFSHPVYLLGLFLAVGTLIISSENLENWKYYLKFSLFLMLLIVTVNIIFSQNGGTVLWRAGAVRISLEALVYALGMSIRLMAIISIFCFYTCVLDPDRGWALFNNIGHRSVLAITLSTRLFPLLLNDSKRIKDVQRSRGVSFDTGSRLTRIKNYIPLINILLMSSLDRSIQLAESMQARGYGSGPRSSYRREVWHLRDSIVVLNLIFVVVLALWTSFNGMAVLNYYPFLDEIDLKECSLAAIIMIILMMPAILNWGWIKWSRLRSII